MPLYLLRCQWLIVGWLVLLVYCLFSFRKPVTDVRQKMATTPHLAFKLTTHSYNNNYMLALLNLYPRMVKRRGTKPPNRVTTNAKHHQAQPNTKVARTNIPLLKRLEESATKRANGWVWPNFGTRRTEDVEDGVHCAPKTHTLSTSQHTSEASTSECHSEDTP
jgi:hypothetical protein